MSALALPSFENLDDIRMSDGELKRVLLRIGLQAHGSGTLPATKETMYLVHRAMFHAVPFENLAVFDSEAVSLDLPDIVDKICGVEGMSEGVGHVLMRSTRGGYCFELNKLLGATLIKLGFEVEPKIGRVLNDHGTERGPYRPPQTHQTLVVRLPSEPEVHYLCDVGFGRTALYEPLPFAAEGPVRNGHTMVELRRNMHTTRFGYPCENRELWYEKEGTWVRGYTFCANQDYRWLDCVGPNMTVYGHFDSKFTQTLWVQSRTAERHHMLFGGKFTVEGPAGKEVMDIQSAEHIRYLMEHYFEMIVPLPLCRHIFGITTSPGVDSKWVYLNLAREPHRAALQGAPAPSGTRFWSQILDFLGSRYGLLTGAGAAAAAFGIGRLTRRW